MWPVTYIHCSQAWYYKSMGNIYDGSIVAPNVSAPGFEPGDIVSATLNIVERTGLPFPSPIHLLSACDCCLSVCNVDHVPAYRLIKFFCATVPTSA